jgi:putative hemolysin
MMLLVLLLFAGVFLSAFFSGSETGFYRMTRVRLVLDSLDGDRIARGLLWLANRPALFVATLLVGNNVANYLVSLAIVLAAAELGGGAAAEILAPLLLSPLLFVYGELFPKSLYFHAPNRLMRRGGGLLLLCAAVLAPVSGLLWAFGKVLECLAGQSHPQVKLQLARRELQSVLEEGHEVGVLLPAQRQIAQGMFAVAKEPVRQFARPIGRIARARLSTSKAEMLRLARRQRLAALPVEDDTPQRTLLGYIPVAELALSESDPRELIRPFLQLSPDETHLAALVRLYTAGEDLALLVDRDGRPWGLITTSQLLEPLFRSGR